MLSSWLNSHTSFGLLDIRGVIEINTFIAVLHIDVCIFVPDVLTILAVISGLNEVAMANNPSYFPFFFHYQGVKNKLFFKNKTHSGFDVIMYLLLLLLFFFPSLVRHSC